MFGTTPTPTTATNASTDRPDTVRAPVSAARSR